MHTMRLIKIMYDHLGWYDRFCNSILLEVVEKCVRGRFNLTLKFRASFK